MKVFHLAFLVNMLCSFAAALQLTATAARQAIRRLASQHPEIVPIAKLFAGLATGATVVGADREPVRKALGLSESDLQHLAKVSEALGEPFFNTFQK